MSRSILADTLVFLAALVLIAAFAVLSLRPSREITWPHDRSVAADTFDPRITIDRGN